LGLVVAGCFGKYILSIDCSVGPQQIQAKENGQAATPNQNPAANGPVMIDLSQPNIKNAEGDTEHSYKQQNRFCDIRITDIAIGLFTYCLVVVGAFQLYRQEFILRESERAHVFAGPSGRIETGNNFVVYLETYNYGRTAGIIKKIYAEFSATEPTKEINYAAVGAEYIYDYLIKPNSLGEAMDPFRSTSNAECYFIGFVSYVDMFRKHHISKFCVRIQPPGPGQRGRYVPVGPPALNGWT
jgi:hypothetical protein